MSTANGRFVWFELMTPDISGAKSFYAELVGWKVQGSGDYEMWTVGDEPVGGLMTLPREMNVPPHWLGYVAVDDVDQVSQQAAAKGGKVLRPGSDIPDTGRFAVLADPQGAVFAIYRSFRPEHGGAPDMMRLGNVGWSELNTTDAKGAWAFYSELFGWKELSSMDMGPEFGAYQIFGSGPATEDTVGGMSNAATMMKAPAHWLHYFNVPSVEQAAELVKKRGGQVLNGPMEVPGGSWIVQGQDPQGAHFAIVSQKK